MNDQKKARRQVIHPTPEEIATRAYSLFLERGGLHGHSVEDWLKAEGELIRSLAISKPAGKSDYSLGLRLME